MARYFVNGNLCMVVGTLACATSLGCQSRWLDWDRPACEFEIVDEREPGNVRRYQETFDEAYYDMDNHGNVHIVLRRGASGGSAGGPDLTQVIRIRTVWRSIPGRTVSHPTHINAVVSYYLTGGRVGDTLEGAGSVLFTHNRRSEVLKGTLDHSVLRTKRQLAPAEPLFPQAELTGRFQAVRDRRRVVQIVNELDRAFGPLPPPDTPSANTR